MPATVINPAPSARIAFLPKASANRVNRKLIQTSPTRVRVMKRPIFVSEMPTALRYATRMSVEPPYAKRRMNRWMQRSLVSIVEE